MTVQEIRHHWLTWMVILVMVTAVLFLFRDHMEKTHVALAYLLLVLLGSAHGGHRVGFVLTGISFILLDWGFILPYRTLAVTHSPDWFILGAFLVVSLVAAELLHRAQREAHITRERETLRESNRLQNALLASVSHDLRTPLTTIKALAHDLARIDDRALVIEEEADRLNRMVADLLDLTRVRSGTALSGIAINPVDDLVGAVLQRVSGAMPAREIRVSLEEGGTLLIGRFDLAAALRILVNLLENADKYSPAGSAIDFIVARRGEWIEFVVADAGAGVPETERERIFDAFYRRSGTPLDSTGAGLGLAIARGLAEAQGGTLRHSTRTGGGSLFVLALPAADLPEHYGND